MCKHLRDCALHFLGGVQTVHLAHKVSGELGRPTERCAGILRTCLKVIPGRVTWRDFGLAHRWGATGFR